MEYVYISIVLCMMVVGSSAQFNPIVTVDSCTKSRLKLTLIDGADNGLIYIQGQGVACKDLTTSGQTTHEFNFASCGITWESSFKVIVQKKALYQTGDDKQIPIMCQADLSDISVDNGLNVVDKADDAGQNLTIKPTAFMKLYSNGVDITGGYVKLTDRIILTIELDEVYRTDFDIKARYCTASTIPVVENSCATDIELFPEFKKPAQGYLSSTFWAFRTTDLNGGSVPMLFTCSLQICLGSCSNTTCSSDEEGWGRKKRDVMDVTVSRGTRQGRSEDDNRPFDNISVGTTLRVTDDVVIEGKETTHISVTTILPEVTSDSTRGGHTSSTQRNPPIIIIDEGDTEVCMDKTAMAATAIAASGAIASTVGTSIFMAKKLIAQKIALKALNSKC